MSNINIEQKIIKDCYGELNFSTHSLKRISLRKIDKKIVETCVEYGKLFYKTGIKFYVLLRKTIEKFHLDKKLEGICVLLSNDNTVITVYKNKKISREIKILSKQNNKKQIIGKNKYKTKLF